MKRSIHVVVNLALVVTVSALSKNQIDRETGWFVSFIFPRVFDEIVTTKLETPIQIRSIFHLQLATWNAWCNYHPTAVDIFGRSRFKRPKSEHNLKNKNVAIMFSLFRMYEASPSSFGGPSGLSEFRKIIKEQGYDPDDRSLDMLSPVGIGSREGIDTARLLSIDGWNSDGDLTVFEDNYKLPFQDQTGYIPKNTPWSLRYPFKWQPLIQTNGNGFFYSQEFVTPQAANSVSYSLTPSEMVRRKLSNPYLKSHAKARNELPVDFYKLKDNAIKVLNISAHLTERQQVLAELFDNKVRAFVSDRYRFGVLGIAGAIRFGVLPNPLNWTFDDDVIYGLGANLVSYEATIVAWKEKRRIDAVRPTGQTMRYLFGNKKFKVWGGPGKRPVKMKAANWKPYIRTMPHPEFPSASACLCTALVEHALIASGDRNDFPYSFIVPKGVSAFYPREVPSSDMTIRINKLTDWAKLCGTSRLWAGVHFEPAIKAGNRLCRGLGRKGQDVIDGMLAGQSNGEWLKWLPESIEKFWEK